MATKKPVSAIETSTPVVKAKKAPSKRTAADRAESATEKKATAAKKKDLAERGQTSKPDPYNGKGSPEVANAIANVGKKAPPGFRLVPLVVVNNEGTAALNSLTGKFPMNVSTIKGNKPVQAGFLVMNRSVDILGLSYDSNWEEEGIIKIGDTVFDDVSLSALLVSIGGEDKLLTVVSSSHRFNNIDNQPRHNKELKTTVISKHNGRNFIISLDGTIDINSGRVFMTAIVPLGVVLKGYMLNAHRQVAE